MNCHNDKHANVSFCTSHNALAEPRVRLKTRSEIFAEQPVSPSTPQKPDISRHSRAGVAKNAGSRPTIPDIPSDKSRQFPTVPDNSRHTRVDRARPGK
jgi:hypothetical protein